MLAIDRAIASYPVAPHAAATPRPRRRPASCSRLRLWCREPAAEADQREGPLGRWRVLRHQDQGPLGKRREGLEVAPPRSTRSVAPGGSPSEPSSPAASASATAGGRAPTARGHRRRGSSPRRPGRAGSDGRCRRASGHPARAPTARARARTGRAPLGTRGQRRRRRQRERPPRAQPADRATRGGGGRARQRHRPASRWPGPGASARIRASVAWRRTRSPGRRSSTTASASSACRNARRRPAPGSTTSSPRSTASAQGAVQVRPGPVPRQLHQLRFGRPADGRDDPERAPRRGVDGADAGEEQLPERPGDRLRRADTGRDELLHEERVPLRPPGDRVDDGDGRPRRRRARGPAVRSAAPSSGPTSIRVERPVRASSARTGGSGCRRWSSSVRYVATQQGASVPEPAGQVVEELERGPVGPVDVLEDEDERVGRPVEDRAHRLVHAAAAAPSAGRRRPCPVRAPAGGSRGRAGPRREARRRPRPGLRRDDRATRRTARRAGGRRPARRTTRRRRSPRRRAGAPAARATRRVLPTPASPATRATGRSARSRTASSRARSSASRPIRMGLVRRALTRAPYAARCAGEGPDGPS